MGPLVAALSALDGQIAIATRELKRRAAADPVCVHVRLEPTGVNAGGGRRTTYRQD